MNILTDAINLCPVCGAFRVLETEGMAACVNLCCPIYGKTLPIALKTDKEALTYSGWIPEKYRIGHREGWRYFNPKLYRDKVIKTNTHYTRAITFI